MAPTTGRRGPVMFTSGFPEKKKKKKKMKAKKKKMTAKEEKKKKKKKNDDDDEEEEEGHSGECTCHHPARISWHADRQTRHSLLRGRAPKASTKVRPPTSLHVA